MLREKLSLFFSASLVLGCGKEKVKQEKGSMGEGLKKVQVGGLQWSEGRDFR